MSLCASSSNVLLTPDSFPSDARADVVPKNFCEFFAEQAKSNPYGIAIRSGAHTVTYEELNQQSDALACYLRRKGIRSEIVVGVSLPNCVDLIISVLGILKAGGVYLPLDPEYPIERLQYMLADAKPALLLTHSAYAHQFDNHQANIFFVDTQLTELGTVDYESAFATIIQANSLAYIIYTSGSTGKPKGIMVTHENCCSIAIAHRCFYPKHTVALLTGSISFDVSLLLIFHVLATGGTLCLPYETSRVNVEDMAEMISSYAVNTLVMVPSLYAALLQISPALLSLESVSLTGEAMPNSLIELHARIASHAVLYNEYGPSECAIGATIAKIYDPLNHRINPLTIGQTLPNTQIYIIGENGKPVQRDSRGEIYIGGSGLAKGYLNQQTLTDEKFIWLSINDQPMQRLYKTGDVGHLLSNGEIELLGRVDNQVKIRGLRIEPGEIEHAICQHPGIKEAVVLTCARAETTYLVAYYTSLKTIVLDRELRNFLVKALPKQMIPSKFIWIESFPLTPNGKINRKKLATYDVADPEQTQKNSLLEENLLGLWKQLLNVEKVGLNDNFFDLGGDSLQAAFMQNLIENSIGKRIAIIDLFHYPTIAQLANYLKKQTIPSSPISKTSRKKIAEMQKATFAKYKKERSLKA